MGDNLPGFGRDFFGGSESFTRIGGGGIGGKAAGLDRVRREVLAGLDPRPFGIEVVVPTLTVLGTELFDAFMAQGDLLRLTREDPPDDRIAHAFQQASLPAQYLGDLRALIQGVRSPLAVRSSSLLEDALAHPFAGVYGTKMIPNNQPAIDDRFRRLVDAIKFVYASTFFGPARAYLRATGQEPGSEKMAIVVQEIVGRRWNDRHYPALSGVARSWNYYPSGHSRPEDGVVSLALGLGKQIVDGGASWTYSPAWPQAPAPFKDLGELLKNTQTEFWAVGMGRPPLPDPMRETEYLVHPGLKEAELDGSLDQLVSSYDPRSERLRPGLGAPGPRVLDFAPILQLETVALNDLVRELLARAERALGAATEIEFAVDLGPGGAARFGFLQMRPMMVSNDAVSVTEDDLAADGLLLASERALGNGERRDLLDVVYLRPQAFEARHTTRIAAELERFNHELVQAGRPYLLIGFGRWGSTDPWLGVPVEWGQIAGARAIVESTLPEMNPDLSQGSHFFHNLIGFQVLYLALRHGGPHRIDWEWLDAQPAAAETELVRHVRLSAPLLARVDGRSGRGVIQRHA